MNETVLSGVLGGPCGDPDSGDCFEANGSPGCNDAVCCFLVCESDPVCCILDWDQTCADSAINICSPPLAGSPPTAYHVVTADGVDDSVRIDGFTITDGLANGALGDDRGAGMSIRNASPAVVRITFTANAAPGHGGGAMNITGTSDPLVVNCEFIENTGKEAGALHTEGGMPGGTFVNCLFSKNISVEQGGAINPGGAGTLAFINCTFADNSVMNGAGGNAIFTEGAGLSVNLTNCILWGNAFGGSANQIVDPSGVLTATFSDVEGDWGDPPDMNIDDDPLFVDPDNGDYRLDDLSPCIDVGDTDDSIIPCDQFDLDTDGVTCDEMDPDFYEPTPDLDLLNRVTDGDGIDGDRVDMGAYEFCDPDGCPWDLDDGGFVGAGDLLLLLANWGNPYGASDLLDLLAAWGACPCFSVEPPTLAQELTAACLSNDDWQDFLDALDTGTTAEQVNYICWLTHYFEDCTRCICIGQSGCPGADPFN